MPQVTEEDYAQAQSVRSLAVRQEFVESLDLGENVDCRRYYSPSFRFALMAINFYNQSKPVLEIYPCAFIFEFPIFMNILLNHEVHHYRREQICHGSSWELMKKRQEISEIYEDAVEEIPAYLSELENMPRLEHPNLCYIDSLYDDVHLYERTMRRQAIMLGRDWRKDLSGILCPSPLDDIVRARYRID